MLWTAGFQTHFQGLGWPDALDYAQMGRELAEGRGFASLQTFPYVLAWLDAHGHATEPPWPNVTRFVLPTLLKAASFRVFGEGDLAAVLPDAGLLAATVALCFLLGSRLSGAVAGWCAAVLVVASPTALGYARSGLTETGASFLLLAMGAALAAVVSSRNAAPSRARGIGGAALLGALIALGYLQRSNLVVGLPVALLVVLVAAHTASLAERLRVVVTTAVAAALVASPWLIRNAIGFGSPLLSLTNDRSLSLGLDGRDPFYGFDLVDVPALLASSWSVLTARLVDYGWLLDHWGSLFGDEMVLVGPLLLATAVVPLAGEGRAVRRFLFGCLFLTWIVFGTGFREPRYFHPFAPLAVVVVACCAVELLRRHLGRPGERALAAACTTLALWWTVGAATPPAVPFDPTFAAWEKRLQAEVPDGSIVASDRSWLVSWYAKRHSVRFYGERAHLERLSRDGVPADFVWLAGPSSRRFLRELAEGGRPGAWRLVHRTADGTSLWAAGPSEGS